MSNEYGRALGQLHNELVSTWTVHGPDAARRQIEEMDSTIVKDLVLLTVGTNASLF